MQTAEVLEYSRFEYVPCTSPRPPTRRLEDQLGALGLVVDCVTLWNAVYLDRALGVLGEQGYPVLDEDVMRLSAYVRKHINVHGHYSFQLPDLGGSWFAGADATEGAEPLFLLQAQAVSLVGGVQQMEPDPDAPAGDPLLEVAASAAAALAGLLSARRALAVGSDPQQAVGQAAAGGVQEDPGSGLAPPTAAESTIAVT
jgi:Tn3 transposase DDE domain